MTLKKLRATVDNLVKKKAWDDIMFHKLTDDISIKVASRKRDFTKDTLMAVLHLEGETYVLVAGRIRPAVLSKKGLKKLQANSLQKPYKAPKKDKYDHLNADKPKKSKSKKKVKKDKSKKKSAKVKYEKPIKRVAYGEYFKCAWVKVFMTDGTYALATALDQGVAVTRHKLFAKSHPDVDKVLSKGFDSLYAQDNKATYEQVQQELVDQLRNMYD